MSGQLASSEAAAEIERQRGRSVAIWLVLALSGVLLLVATFAVWVNRVALDTDVFVDTSTELIEDDAIRTAVATRAVDELFESVDVETEIEGQLPSDYKSLSGPATAGLREASYTLVGRALEQPRLQRLWALTLEQSHRTLVAVLQEEGETVSTEEGVVALDLEQIVLEAADRIGIRDQVVEKLPQDVGRVEILRSDELDTAQNGVQVLKALAWVLSVLALGAFGLAVWLARDRRRLVLRIGVVIVLAGLLGLVAVSLVGNYLVSSLVAETETRTAAGNAWDILTELLRASYRGLIAIGALFFMASWLAGPGPRALEARRFIAPAVRPRLWAYAGLALVGLILLATSAVADATRFLLVVALVGLGALWIELTRAQTMREFPDSSSSVLLAETRTRITTWWEARRAAASVTPHTPARAGDLTSNLATLAELHAGGDLTDEEYAAAKARVLAGD